MLYLVSGKTERNGETPLRGRKYSASVDNTLLDLQNSSYPTQPHSLRNRKHVPCFYRVIQTRVEVWENEKCRGNTSRRRVFPQPFRVLPNFHECLYNSTETRSTCFLFLLENNATRKRKTTSYFLSKCKFSLLTSSLRQQRALVLCLHRVIQTRFLTNQRACFLRTVF